MSLLLLALQSSPLPPAPRPTISRVERLVVGRGHVAQGGALRGPSPSVGLELPAWVDAGPFSIQSLIDEGEARLVPPGTAPKLIALAPWKAHGPLTVLVHGIGGDPGNQEILARSAQARGDRVVVVAYDTWTRGASANAIDLARKLRAIKQAGAQAQPLAIVAHSLGALTMKGAFDRAWGANGRYMGPPCRFVALGAPWAGASPATMARFVLPGWRPLAWLRDLDPSSPYWHRLRHTPFPREVAFYDVQGEWDSFAGIAWGPERQRDMEWVRAQARRWDVVPAATHNAPNWDPRVVAWALDPAQEPLPSSSEGPGRVGTLVREVAATLGLTSAFSDERPW